MRVKLLSLLIAGAAFGGLAAGAAEASETKLGGVELNAYCQSQGYDRAELSGPAQGPNAAYNWHCVSGTSSRGIDVSAACRQQYSQPAAYAKTSNVNDAYSWACYVASALNYYEHEPNNNQSQATPVVHGGAYYHGTIANSGDQDWFRFTTVNSERQITVTIQNTTAYPYSDGSCVVGFIATDASGNPVGDSFGDSWDVNQTGYVKWNAAPDTPYFLHFSPYGGGDCTASTGVTYRFSITPSSAVASHCRTVVRHGHRRRVCK